jgi:DNA mismatch endonuclease (patch repair protein)
MRNGRFWRSKIDANKDRDQDTINKLRLADWRVLRFWEHEQLDRCVDEVFYALKNSC